VSLPLTTTPVEVSVFALELVDKAFSSTHAPSNKVERTKLKILMLFEVRKRNVKAPN
jgi:hypothetical protein